MLDYAFNKFCDDEEFAKMIEIYYEALKIEAAKAEAKKEKAATTECETKPSKTYKLTEDVRNWLEPLVDAEYFKNANYTQVYDMEIIYKAAEQLKTKGYVLLKSKMLKEVSND